MVKLVLTNNSCGKKDSTTQTILIPARPAVNLGSDTVSCTNGTTIPLNATSHTGATYYWYTGSTQPNITVGGVVSAWVEVTYAGCKARDTINIYVNPIAKRALQTKALCNVTTISLEAARSQGEQYQWNTGAITAAITVAQPGTYWVDVYLKGCTTKDSFLVVSTSLRPLGNDTTICQRNIPYQLDATINGANNYLWQDNSTNPKQNISKAGLYWVDVNLGGCTFRDSLVVKVDSFKLNNLVAKICEGKYYVLPSGKQVSLAGNHTDTLRKANGCDSLITSLALSVNKVVRTTTAASICAGQNYTLPTGVKVSLPGSYTDSIRYVGGCDSSISTINLTIKSLVRTTTNVTIGQNQTYTLPSGKIVSTQGIFSDTVRYTSGCDSLIATTNLTVNISGVVNLVASVCKGDAYTLPSGRKIFVDGNYRDTLKYTTGFDSLITNVSLSVNEVTKQINSVSVCTGQMYTLPSGRVIGTAGNYVDTVRYISGCDSLISTVTLSIKPLVRATLNLIICQGQSYTFPSGKTSFTTGNFSDTIRYQTGCDSLVTTINLKVNAVTRISKDATICEGQSYSLPSGKLVSLAATYADTLRYKNGCDSIITNTSLTIKTLTRKSFSTSVCTGQTYILQSGKVVASAGNYIDTVRYISGCNSLISTVTLSIKPLVRATLSPDICQGQSYTFPSGKTSFTTGNFSDTIRYQTGCDSLVTTIQLTVKGVVQLITLSPKICAGQNYILPSGKQIKLSGSYFDTLRYTMGCDSSRYTIYLTVLDVTRNTVAATICAGQLYTLPSGRTVNVTGIFSDTVRFKFGCDSLISTTTITLKQAVRKNISAIICAGEVYTLPTGKTLNSSGIFSDTLRYIGGCDSSILIVNLTVQPVIQTMISANICQGLTYRLPSGKLISASGLYSDTLRYTTGCDSVITKVNMLVSIPITQTVNAGICLGDSYLLPGGRLVNTAGSFTDIIKNSRGCDSIITNLVLTINPLPVVSISKSNDINCILGSATLTATGGARFRWSPETFLSSIIAANPVATPIKTTTYTARVTTAKGCIAEGSIELKVITDNIDGGYLLPSAFTPNSDGKNDCFGVKAWGLVSNLQFSIFDRWGHMLFSTTDPSRCWDGSYNGIAQSTGGYVFSIIAVTACGPVVRKGTVVLIR